MSIPNKKSNPEISTVVAQHHINSMTGFARSEINSSVGLITVELKSVNSRFLDFFCKAPDTLKSLEIIIKNRISQRISRGKIECFIRWNKAPNTEIFINESLIESILKATDRLSSKLQREKVPLSAILSLSGVIMDSKPCHDDENLHAAILQAIDIALLSLVSERQREGQFLQQTLENRLTEIKQIIAQTAQHFSENKVLIHKKLTAQVANLAIDINPERFEQELLFLLNKSDIAEELDRLASHLSESFTLLKTESIIGRKMDFLLQEMNRESNTIASKANAFNVSMDAIELKVLLEQVREQIQNIE